MRPTFLAAAFFLLCCGCQQGFHPYVGRSVAFEHWFPVAHHTPVGVNTRSKPPCPYFDPLATDGSYSFCDECGVYHTAH